MMFGLEENELDPLVVSAAGRDLSRGEREELFARAAWTGIAEPGDGTAGALVAALGAALAFRVVRGSSTAREIVALAAEHGTELTADAVQRGLDRWGSRMRSEEALHALKQAARVGARLLAPGDEAWPVGVDDLGDHAPIALWVRGRDSAVRALSQSIALVGARAATGYGEQVTMEASAGLVDRGYTIVSGAAYGIDGMAHRAALASRGNTVAFLAGGVDRFYPAGHDALLGRIVELGAVISELPCGQAPTKWRFLQSNRKYRCVGFS
jgi:DNA processing protein